MTGEVSILKIGGAANTIRVAMNTAIIVQKTTKPYVPMYC